MSKPSKRSRSRDDKNPLSSARKDSGSSASRSSSTNKADQNASALWHRKSGAGYHLFVSYYASQPLGVVVANDHVDDNAIDSVARKDGSGRLSNNKSNKGNVVSGGEGMSRAAKRRRQKQNKSSGVQRSCEEGKQGEASSSSSCNGYDHSSNTQKQFDASHPLIQAFNSSLRNSKDNQHLTNFAYALSRPLPLTFRFRRHEVKSSSTTKLKQQLATHYSEYIEPVSYDPTNNIYQSTTNSSLCKSNLKKLSPKLKELIVNGSMDGTIARQELGSMLPVISLLGVGAIKRGSKVLDLCASPGSKTLQALEIVCGNNNNDNGSNSKKMGRVIANDIHSGRLDSLREAVLRSGVPESLTSKVTYTNFDASKFPSPKSGKLMDAIICDVPCGGDGTIRKDPHILPMWSPNISNTIHKLQLKILLRALQLVKVNGVVCYSTCSLNPVEDEAVVSAALRQVNNCDDGEDVNNAKFELLELPANMLPGFKRRPGVCKWKVAFYDKDNVKEDGDDWGSLSFFDNYDDASTGRMEDITPTYWPNVTENKRMALERCTRLLPQDHDTGGFFLALILRKK